MGIYKYRDISAISRLTATKNIIIPIKYKSDKINTLEQSKQDRLFRLIRYS